MPLYSLDGHHPELPAAGEAWIAPDAVLIGRVRIAPGASVWWGAVLRGDNELIDIGPGSNVQDGCVLHTDMGFPMTIGAGCTVGHKAILHGCVLEDNVLVGMGAVVLNGARIGRNSLVGAKALVPEGRHIPERSLAVGVPAKVVRELSDEGIAGLEASARGYVANWRRYAAGLRPV
ncbi:gamma carbonic anhydrase family protein [Pseudoxanthobacter sp. M-2]|uniref:gamma carbonic anhydrase family protein n=1 Tax=Pseudoxanthobacter sp. M-2 TaxID=3078754 RepID=UPI0038FCE07E